VFKRDCDEIIRPGRDGYIVAYGEMLYRCLHVVEMLKDEGIEIGLINKPVLNVVDEAVLATVGASPMALVIETQNSKTGLGVRYGTWLLERGFTPKYGAMGTWKDGAGGLSEQIPYQGMSTEAIRDKVLQMLKG
jgi:transketolase C-terminal domain/subunit